MIPLSPREAEVCRLLCEDGSVKEIAHRLQIAEKTVDVHKYNLYKKLGVHTRIGLFRHVLAVGAIEVREAPGSEFARLAARLDSIEQKIDRMAVRWI